MGVWGRGLAGGAVSGSVICIVRGGLVVLFLFLFLFAFAFVFCFALVYELCPVDNNEEYLTVNLSTFSETFVLRVFY